jgi:hypothetical protein
MDRMDTTELAANQFRMTQTRDKLARERIRDPQQAIHTHQQVGREVRAAIERIGGTLPENLPPAEHIEHVAERVKGAAPKIGKGPRSGVCIRRLGKGPRSRGVVHPKAWEGPPVARGSASEGLGRAPGRAG